MVDAAASRDHTTQAPNEEALLIRASQDDPAAFAVLYERYLDRIYAYLRARAPSEEDAADLTQHVFLQALSALPRYSIQQTPFAAWLFRIARNAAIDYRRRQRPSVAWDLMPDALRPAGEDGPEAWVLRRESLERLRALVNSCDDETRELLMLRYGARLSIKELALVVGKRESTVKKKLLRTIQKFKEQYDDAAR